MTPLLGIIGWALAGAFAACAVALPLAVMDAYEDIQKRADELEARLADERHENDLLRLRLDPEFQRARQEAEASAEGIVNLRDWRGRRA